MRFLDCCIVLAFLFISVSTAYPVGILCNTDKTVCTAGNYIMRGPNLYIEDGIMCTENRSLCTNGFAVFRKGDFLRKDKECLQKTDKVRNDKKEIIHISKAEELAKLSELYKKGLLTQTEFNRAKSCTKCLHVNELDELTKLAQLYKSGVITQIEFNSKKAKIFGH